jgi:hypothetical protein
MAWTLKELDKKLTTLKELEKITDRQMQSAEPAPQDEKIVVRIRTSYWCDKRGIHIKKSINTLRKPAKIVDGTMMNPLDICEMVCDWLAMAEEKGTNAKDWANKNVNIRWQFDNWQVKHINKFLEYGVK